MHLFNMLCPNTKFMTVPKWQVSLDGDAFTFRSEAEARAFADTLQARIQAPHRIPLNQQRFAAG
ncbi:hypothetical protein SAMN04490179_0021 [Pseudomonas antarctica]|uniref:Uncharacterized protein n=2 Tax=Pseudomonas antarctica TaxID=219572 RepID=A0A1G9UJG6_9PSED|nr:hypothetical protein PSAN_06920 [Pseudomonas antarctica]SDM60051.1 hypothetical protein SAMN04490179_0021 [Pseudomonas antarctica]